MCRLGESGGKVKGTAVWPSSSLTPTSATAGRLAPPASSGTSSAHRPSSLHCLKSFWFSSSLSAAGWPEAKRSRMFFSSGISSLRTNFFTRSRSIFCSSFTLNMPSIASSYFPMPLFTNSSV